MTTKYSICNKDYQVTLTDLFKFELRSLYGRIILKSQLKLQKKLQKIIKFRLWYNLF